MKRGKFKWCIDDNDLLDSSGDQWWSPPEAAWSMQLSIFQFICILMQETSQNTTQSAQLLIIYLKTGSIITHLLGLFSQKKKKIWFAFKCIKIDYSRKKCVHSGFVKMPDALAIYTYIFEIHAYLQQPRAPSSPHHTNSIIINIRYPVIWKKVARIYRRIVYIVSTFISNSARFEYLYEV